MKNILHKILAAVLIGQLLSSASFAQSANDLRFTQRNPANTSWADRIITPAGGGALTDAASVRVAIGAQGTITFGTGVQTALGVNVGTAGALVINGGVLGTPSSGTATNLTGLPLTTGVTGTLTVPNGGTGATALSGLIIGNGTSAMTASVPTLATSYTQQPGLRNFWNKLAQIGAGNTNVRCTLMVTGDSLGYGYNPIMFQIPRYRAAFGQAGVASLFGLSSVMSPGGNATITINDDFTKSPVGCYTTINTTTPDASLAPWSSIANAYPYPVAINSNNGQQAGATSIAVNYTQESGAGTFKVQYQVSGSGTWNDVSGLTSISASGATASVWASGTISSSTVTNVRGLWLSGSDVKLVAAKVIAGSGTGMVVFDISRGGMDMGSAAASALTTAFMAGFTTPDLITLAARDTAASWSANLTAYDGLFGSSTDRIIFGINEAADDTPSPTVINAYNAITEAYCASKYNAYTGPTYLYYDIHRKQGSYATANALGWMADVTHPNNRLLSACDGPLAQAIGIENGPYGLSWRAYDLLLASQVNTSALVSGGTLAVTGNATFTGGLTTAGNITFSTNNRWIGLDANNRLNFQSGTVAFYGTGALGTGALLGQFNSAGQLYAAGTFVMGSAPTTITAATGKILSAALETVGVAQGGTGQTTYTNGQMLIGNTTGNTLTKATLTGGAGVTVTNGTGSSTLTQTGMTALRTGTATLVGGTVTVSDAATTANTRIKLSMVTPGGTPGAQGVYAKVNATSFTITSTSASDTSVIYYEAFEP